MYKKLIPFALAAFLSLPTLADEASVKKAVEAKIGGPVTSVTKTTYLGLYEVYADGQVLYTDEKVSALLIGSLIDGKTMKNVTTERMQKLTAIKFSELPLAQAVKQVRGDGKRVFATFEDPNCGYCKKMAKEIAKLDNVTIYTFLYPILSPDSLEKSNQIWCASDRSRPGTTGWSMARRPQARAIATPQRSRRPSKRVASWRSTERRRSSLPMAKEFRAPFHWPGSSRNSPRRQARANDSLRRLATTGLTGAAGRPGASTIRKGDLEGGVPESIRRKRWHARDDSNVRPLPSEGSTLSN
jgi:thiol:disulfide interchange protein DsbC